MERNSKIFGCLITVLVIETAILLSLVAFAPDQPKPLDTQQKYNIIYQAFSIFLVVFVSVMVYLERYEKGAVSKEDWIAIILTGMLIIAIIFVLATVLVLAAL